MSLLFLMPRACACRVSRRKWTAASRHGVHGVILLLTRDGSKVLLLRRSRRKVQQTPNIKGFGHGSTPRRRRRDGDDPRNHALLDDPEAARHNREGTGGLVVVVVGVREGGQACGFLLDGPEAAGHNRDGAGRLVVVLGGREAGRICRLPAAQCNRATQRGGGSCNETGSRT